MELTLPPKVTDRAFARLAEIAEAMGEVKPLRVAVDGGGCSGFQYSITLDEPAVDDLVLEADAPAEQLAALRQVGVRIHQSGAVS